MKTRGFLDHRDRHRELARIEQWWGPTRLAYRLGSSHGRRGRKTKDKK